MPTNKNAMTRYRILDRLLSDKYHNYTIDDLVDEVNIGLAELDPDTDGVGRRCIEKDLKYLEEGPFVAEIERYSATRYSEEKRRNVSRRCLRTFPMPQFTQRGMTRRLRPATAQIGGPNASPFAKFSVSLQSG